MIKPEIIAEPINPSKQSSTSRMITMGMVNLVTTICLDAITSLTGFTFQEPLKKLKHLGVFLKFTAKRCNIEHEKIKDLFTLAEDIAETAAYLSILCWETHDQHWARVADPGAWNRKAIPGPDFESKFSKLLETINPIRPEWRKLYISVLKASHLSVPKVPVMHYSLKNISDDLDLARRFTESIRDDLEELKCREARLNVAFSRRFEWLQVGLLHLSGFHLILARHKDIQHQELSSLLSFVEVLTKEVAIANYSLCDMDLENSNAEVDHLFSPLQVKFNYLKVEISLIQKLRLPESQMDCYQEELKTFLVDSLELCKEQTQLTDVLTLVLSVTTEAESFTNSLSHDSEDGELGRKINPLHFQLHLRIKFIREGIRQICPFLSASSTPVYPVIYPLNFLPTYVEAIGSYFTMLKSSRHHPPQVARQWMRFS